MLINAEKLLGYPILSLHMSGMIAKTTALILDPDELKVVAFYLTGPEIGKEVGDILPVEAIREFSSVGMVIDSADDFVSAGDVIKLDKIIDIDFELIGKKVESKKGSKLGKIIGYVVNTNDFLVQQFAVQRPLMKSFLDPELLIGRSEIVKVTDNKVIVKDEEDKIRKKGMREDFVPNFINPFRAGGAFAPESGAVADTAKEATATSAQKPTLLQADSQSPDASDTE